MARSANLINVGYVPSGPVAKTMPQSTGALRASQIAQQNLGAIQAQPPPIDLTDYIKQQQAMWDAQNAAMAKLQGGALYGMNQLNQLYDPNLGADLARKALGMYDTSGLDAYKAQMEDLYQAGQQPRHSTATWMIGY